MDQNVTGSTSSATGLFETPRRRRQAGLFFGGVAFVVFSSLITRRSVAKRYKAIIPTTPAQPINSSGLTNPISKGQPTSNAGKGYTTAIEEAGGNIASEAGGPEAPSLQNSGPIMAVEALTVATLNVFSWAIMFTGGALWAFDISTMEELRRKVRGGLGVDGTGRTEQDAEEEMEEWLATVLARKEDKKRATDGALKNERGRER